jgi:hypothetical protein
MNRDSSVSKVTGYALHDWGSIQGSCRDFSLRHLIQVSSGTCLASYPMGTRGSSPLVMWPEREADYSPEPSAEVKNTWSCVSICPYYFMP